MPSSPGPEGPLTAEGLAAQIIAQHAESAAIETERLAKGLSIADLILQRISAHRVGPMLNAEGLVADLQAAGYMEEDEDQGDLDPQLALAREAIKAKAASEHSNADSLWARTEPQTEPPSSSDNPAA